VNASQAILEVRHVRHAYRAGSETVEALAEVDLTIDRGDVFVVVGPSGCGKTTLLHMIAGYLTPSAGEILVNGVVSHGPDAQRGIVFQSPTLYPWLTVRKNVEFGPKMAGVPRAKREETAARYLELVGLSDFANRAPYELSGGMQQRVAIARALANEPDLLLMDEPFSALDALTRETLQDEFLQIWGRTRKTIVFITHSVDEAAYLGTRVAVMSKRPGKIVCDMELDFGRRAVAGEGRHVKATQEFGAAREAILESVLAAAR